MSVGVVTSEPVAVPVVPLFSFLPEDQPVHSASFGCSSKNLSNLELKASNALPIVSNNGATNSRIFLTIPVQASIYLPSILPARTPSILNGATTILRTRPKNPNTEPSPLNTFLNGSTQPFKFSPILAKAPPNPCPITRPTQAPIIEPITVPKGPRAVPNIPPTTEPMAAPPVFEICLPKAPPPCFLACNNAGISPITSNSAPRPGTPFIALPIPPILPRPLAHIVPTFIPLIPVGILFNNFVGFMKFLNIFPAPLNIVPAPLKPASHVALLPRALKNLREPNLKDD